MENNKKSKLMKSKSSNTVVSMTSKSDKKTKSNSIIKQDGFKKRGVYVEKKSFCILDQTIENERKKKVIPRPGKTKFLASVLTILSQATAGTQFPDNEEPDTKKPGKKLKTRKESDKEYLEPVYKKPKYKSRILNANKNSPHDLVVLQSKKHFESIASSYSHMTQEKDNSETVMKENASFSSNKALKEKRVRLQDQSEPTTVVAEQAEKQQKDLYNMFVDILETTFSVYNVNEHVNKHFPSEKSSKVKLEIDEAVAKKLTVIPPKQPDKEKPEVHKLTEMYNTNKTKYDDRDNEVDEYYEEPTHDVNDEVRVTKLDLCPRKMIKRRRPILKRVINNNYIKKPEKPVENTEVPYMKYTRRQRKQKILNYLKEELSKDDYESEKPQNFFQALKIMTKNKRKTKTIQFEDMPDEREDNTCILTKRHSSYRNRAKKHNPLYTNTALRCFNATGSFTKKTNEKKVKNEVDDEASRYSLEVYDYGFSYPKQIEERPVIRNNYYRAKTASDMSLYVGNSLTTIEMNAMN